VAVAAAVAAVGLAPAEGVVLRVDRAVAARAARARVARAAAEAVRGRVVTAMAGAEMVEASSSRT
jgi:hypothetical protein